MKTKHKEGCCQKINIVRHDTKSCRYKNRTDVKGILDISIRACHCQNFVLLKVACRPDPNTFPQKDQNHPNPDSWKFGFREDDQ
jgi:hypothetical protein